MTDEQFTAIHAFWSSRRPHAAPNAETVFIDLFHHNQQYLLRSLVIGKYLAEIHGRRAVGLIGHPGVMRPASFHAEEMRRIAHAFCLDEVIEWPGHQSLAAPDTWAALMQHLGSSADGQPLGADQLRRLNTFRDVNGTAIGKWYHDTHLRTDRLAALRTDDAFRQTVAEVNGFHLWASRLVAAAPSAIFVTGHLDYCPYGLFADLLAQAGGHTCYYRCDGRLPLTFIPSTASELGLNGFLHSAQASAVQSFVDRLRTPEDALAAIEPYYRLLGSGTAYTNWRWREQSRVPRPLPEPGPARPVNSPMVLYTHTFCDQPVADDQVFPSHLEWMRHTIRLAEDDPRWPELLVKIHPLNDGYDATGAMAALIAEFRDARRVRFTCDSRETLMGIADAGITVRGSVAFQMTAEGQQILATGRSAASEFGVCLRVHTLSDYEAAVRPGELPGVDRAQMIRARLFSLLDRLILPPNSAIIPEFGEIEEERVWEEVARRFRWHIIESDDLYVSLARHAMTTGVVATAYSMGFCADAVR